MSSADATSASAALPAAGVPAATTAAAAPVPPTTAASAATGGDPISGGADKADEVAIELEPRDDADYETDDQSDNGLCDNPEILLFCVLFFMRSCVPFFYPYVSNLYRWHRWLDFSRRNAFVLIVHALYRTPQIHDFLSPHNNSFA